MFVRLYRVVNIESLIQRKTNRIFVMLRTIYRLIIKQKEKLYPEVRVRIVDAHIKEVNGKNNVTLMFGFATSKWSLLAGKTSEKKETKRKLL
jgi:hypothetical protein